MRKGVVHDLFDGETPQYQNKIQIIRLVETIKYRLWFHIRDNSDHSSQQFSLYEP